MSSLIDHSRLDSWLSSVDELLHETDKVAARAALYMNSQAPIVRNQQEYDLA